MSLPDAEGALRGWLRLNTNIAALVGTRVYFSMPQQDRPQLPFIVFYRVGGSPDGYQHDHPDFIIECWDDIKFKASDLAKVTAYEIMLSNEKKPVIVDNVIVLAGDVNFGPVPNGGTNWAKRYRLDTTFHMRTLSS